MMSSSIRLDNTAVDLGVELQLIEGALKAATDSTSKIGGYSAVLISASRGYVSHMIRFLPHWSPEDDRLPKSVVLKMPTVDKMDSVGKKMQDEAAEQEKSEEGPQMESMDSKNVILLAQKSECAFYNYAKEVNLVNVMEPKCYLANETKPAVLALEDLSDHHFLSFPDGINLKQILQIVDMLASLHAHSIKEPSSFTNKPDLHEPYRQMLDAAMESMVKSIPAQAAAAKKDWPELFDPLADRMPEIGTRIADIEYMHSMNEMFHLPPVLVHGDMHIQNVAFDKHDSDVLRAVFDWQHIHIGSVVDDLARLLCLSVDAEIRRQHLNEILNHYYTSLGDKLKPDKVPFSLETLKRAYDIITRSACALCIGVLLMLAKLDVVLGENAEEKRQKLLRRAKALLEDCLSLMDAGKT